MERAVQVEGQRSCGKEMASGDTVHVTRNVFVRCVDPNNPTALFRLKRPPLSCLRGS